VSEQTTIDQNRIYIIDFHKQSIDLWNEGQKTLQQDSEHNFSKIKSCARELSELMTDRSIVAIAQAISTRNDPKADADGESEEIDKYLRILRKQFIPILDIISRMKIPSAQNVPINHIRRFTVSLFFEYCWDKSDDPADPDFISACVDLFANAEDPIDYTTAEDIISGTPDHLFVFSKEKQQFVSSLLR
jgi:hypothetical protein